MTIRGTTDVDLPQRKMAARSAMRRLLAEIPKAEREERSRLLLRQLVKTPAWCTAARVLLYAPLPTEPDLDVLWRDGALDGKQVIYPRVDGTALRLYHVSAFAELERSRWGLREPPSHAEREVMLEDASVALVPGLAFDAAGGRLGRGGGYYDRLFARRDPTKTRLVGVGFAFQLVAESLPLAAHDVKMDEVCTD